MTTTVQAPAAQTSLKEPKATTVAAPVRLRRHPLWVWAGVALVAAGGVVSVALYGATSDTDAVLTVREPLTRGQVIEADDLAKVSVELDPAVTAVPASELDQLVGQFAATDVPAGALLSPQQVTGQAVPPQGQSVVGLSLTGAMVPGQNLQPGDNVRVVATAGPNGEISDTTTPESIPATVVAVSTDEVTGNLQVEVQVAEETAPRLALLATAGKAAVVVDAASES